jgi:hypothetical protein
LQDQWMETGACYQLQDPEECRCCCYLRYAAAIGRCAKSDAVCQKAATTTLKVCPSFCTGRGTDGACQNLGIGHQLYGTQWLLQSQ